MDELIVVNFDTHTVSARELHEKLNIEKRFSAWFETNSKGFIEGEDFTSVLSGTVVNNGAQRELQDYAISVDMAKHICLMSRTESGKRCRQYLIDLEKAWNTPEQVFARALKMADQTISSLKDRCRFLGGQVVEQQKVIEELQPKYTYYDGEIYKSRKAGIILESIFASAGITKYSIEEEVYNTLLDGYLEIQTCREALQMVCFACGALASDCRSDSVKVYKPDRYVKYTVGPDRKFNGNTSVSLDGYVSGVSIERSVYTLEDKDSEIYNDYLPKGLNRITFSEPYQIASITVTGGTAKTVRTNYIEVQMNKAGTCTITGKKYADAKVAYQENVTHLEAGESESVKSFGTITLYNLKNLPDIAKRLLDYYSLRRKIDMKFLLDLEEVGNWINVTDTSGNTSTTLIESQTIDLTGGFIATASCRGYSVVVTENYYAGTELYAGGGGII